MEMVVGLYLLSVAKLDMVNLQIMDNIMLALARIETDYDGKVLAQYTHGVIQLAGGPALR